MSQLTNKEIQAKKEFQLTTPTFKHFPIDKKFYSMDLED